MSALRASMPASTGPGEPVFLAPKGGLGELTDRLMNGLLTGGATLERRAVRQVRPNDSGPGFPPGSHPGERSGGNREAVTVDDGQVFDGAVLAVPAAAAAGLLGPAAPAGLAGIPTASVTMTVLAYRSGDLSVPADLSGFLVPRVTGRLMTACSFASTKWPHWAGENTTLLRVSVGRYGDDRQDHLDDDELVGAVARELGEVLRTSAQPVGWRVVRWPGSFPQYRVGHLDLVARIEEELRRDTPAIALAGASYRGSGIPACIRSGRQAAASVLVALAPT